MIPIVTHRASFYRLEEESNPNKESWSVFASNIPCNIQPASANPSEIATGVFDKKHILFINNTYSGIREGYRCQIQGLYDGSLNRMFTVDGVEDWNNLLLSHFQITLSELIE